MRKALAGERPEIVAAPEGALDIAVDDVLAEDTAPTPSHVYVGVIRDYLRRHWDVTQLDIAGIGVALRRRGYEVDPASGRVKRFDTSLAPI